MEMEMSEHVNTRMCHTDVVQLVSIYPTHTRFNHHYCQKCYIQYREDIAVRSHCLLDWYWQFFLKAFSLGTSQLRNTIVNISTNVNFKFHLRAKWIYGCSSSYVDSYEVNIYKLEWDLQLLCERRFKNKYNWAFNQKLIHSFNLLLLFFLQALELF